jgi:hypothetical protein
MMSSETDIPCGVYQHYKGNRYLVLGVARHDTTEDVLVIYARLYPRSGLPLSARPIADFTGEVENEKGERVKRFRYIGFQED